MSAGITGWLSPRDLDAPGIRLFCLPHAGSGAAGFYRWKRLLPSSTAVCPVLLPGREARLREPLLPHVADVVDGLWSQAEPHLHRPYALFGHSMGALLAFEWARRIASEGLPSPVCLFCSGRNAPQVPSAHTGLHELEPEPFLQELKARYGGEPEALLGDPELRDVFLPILKNDLRLVESYAYVPGPPLHCEVRALAGEDDASVSARGLDRWAELTMGGFSVRRFPGDHFYPFGVGESELLRFIAATLDEQTSAGLSSSLPAS